MKDMTPRSKWAQLNENAVRYYQAIVYPADPTDFDRSNPQPRAALNRELKRIERKARQEGWF